MAYGCVMASRFGPNLSIMYTLMFQPGVCDGQTMSSTEVQQLNTDQVLIREPVPPNHAPLSCAVVTCMGIEVPRQNEGVQHPLYGLQECLIL